MAICEILITDNNHRIILISFEEMPKWYLAEMWGFDWLLQDFEKDFQAWFLQNSPKIKYLLTVQQS